MSFEDELTELFAEHEDTKKTMEEAKKREDGDRQLFLRAFRDKLLNLIKPALSAVKNHPSSLLTLATFHVGEGTDGYSVYLKVETGRNKEHRLTFSPDYQRKRVLVTKRETPHRVVGLEEVDEALVQEEIIAFLRDVFPSKT